MVAQIRRHAHSRKLRRIVKIAMLYGTSPYNIQAVQMNNASVNPFRDNLKSPIEQAISQHHPIKITRRTGEDFIVLSAED